MVSLAKLQGPLGLALGPCVLFSVLLLAGFLVGGLAVAGVRGCGCRRMLLIFGGAQGAKVTFITRLIFRPISAQILFKNDPAVL